MDTFGPIDKWEVEFTEEERAFIDYVFDRVMEQQDGRGPFIAPLRGGVIYLRGFDVNTDNQLKWLVLQRLRNPIYRTPGNPGMKFINFTWNELLPQEYHDPNAMEKWGCSRMTKDGRPIGPKHFPINEYQVESSLVKRYKWNADTQSYDADKETVQYSGTYDGAGNLIEIKLPDIQ